MGSLACAFAQADSLVDWQKAQQLYQSCGVCHGSDGNTSTQNFPKLAGQNPRYLRKQLADYQSNQRPDPIMSPIARTLSPSDINNLLAYIASFSRTNGAVDPKWLTRGQMLYRAGIQDRGIPACAACHGPAAQGNDEARFPALSGQNNLYLIEQLQSFQDQKRHNDPSQMMQSIAAKLSDTDKQAVVSFIGGLH